MQKNHFYVSEPTGIIKEKKNQTPKETPLPETGKLEKKPKETKKRSSYEVFLALADGTYGEET